MIWIQEFIKLIPHSCEIDFLLTCVRTGKLCFCNIEQYIYRVMNLIVVYHRETDNLQEIRQSRKKKYFCNYDQSLIKNEGDIF